MEFVIHVLYYILYNEKKKKSPRFINRIHFPLKLRLIKCFTGSRFIYRDPVFLGNRQGMWYNHGLNWNDE